MAERENSRVFGSTPISLHAAYFPKVVDVGRARVFFFFPLTLVILIMGDMMYCIVHPFADPSHSHERVTTRGFHTLIEKKVRESGLTASYSGGGEDGEFELARSQLTTPEP